MKYTFRNSLVEKEKTLEVVDNVLQISSEKGVEVFPLSEIVNVHLRFIPSRGRPNLFTTTLTMPNNRKITIPNESFKGIANFEDKSADYKVFTKELFAAIYQQNPRVPFIGGMSAVGYWAMMIFSVVGLMAVLAIIVALFFSVAFSWVALIKLVLIGLYAPSYIKYIKGAKPAVFNYDDVPNRLMPADK